MSLVFEALRRQEGTATQSATAAGSVVVARPSARYAFVVVLVTCAVITLGLAAKAVFDQGYATTAEIAPQPISIVDKPVTASEPLQVRASPTVQASVIREVPVPPPIAEPLVLQGELASAPVAREPEPIAILQQIPSAATAPVALPEVTPEPLPRVEPSAPISDVAVTPTVSAPPAIDTAQILQRFNQAMLAGRMDEASELLATARTELGESHLLSARMQGYFCMKADCLEQSRLAYETILARLPSDREAQYNLVLVSWRQGQQQEARRRAREMQVRYPNDAELRALITQLGES